MTREEFYRVCAFIQIELADRSSVKDDWKVEDRIITNCGGHELVLKPKLIVWESEMHLLLSWCSLHCITVECRFSEGCLVLR